MAVATVTATHAGVRDVRCAGEATPDSVFAMASLAKPVTAIVALRLVHRGVLDLDAPADRYLAGGRIRTPSGRPVRLRQLLTHSGGAAFLRSAGDFARPTIWLGGRRARTPLELYGRDPRLPADPDTVWTYGSHGHGLVQMVVEEATGQAFATVAQEELFGPLDLSGLTFGHDPPRHAPVAPGSRHRRFSPLAAGALWGTPVDLARLLAAVLRGGEWLPPPLSAELTTPQPFGQGVNPFMGLGFRLRHDSDGVVGIHGGRWWGSYGWVEVAPAGGAVRATLSTGAPTAPPRRTGSTVPCNGASDGDEAPPAGTYRVAGGLVAAPMPRLAFGGAIRVEHRLSGPRLYSRWGRLREGAALTPLGGSRWRVGTGARATELAVVPTDQGAALLFATPMCCLLSTDPSGRGSSRPSR